MTTTSASVTVEEVDDDLEGFSLDVIGRTLRIDVAVDVVAPRTPLRVGPLLGEQLVGEPEDALQLVLLTAQHQDRDVDAVEPPRHLPRVGDRAAGPLDAAHLEG